MSRYCVIGSGISGATIAHLLSKKNSVDLFDKARGPGGRSSFKRFDKKKGLIMVPNTFPQKVYYLKNLYKN